MRGDSLGSTDGKVLLYYEVIKLGSTYGKVIGTIIESLRKTYLGLVLEQSWDI